MRDDLDLREPLGIGKSNDPFWKGFKHDCGKKDSVVDFLFRIKKQHPQKIVIIQVGEFYETWGIDSVFLVEHCGLNRMGKGGPRAGAPLANIQILLDGLTKAGFSVVVCEQTGDSKNGRKTRFLAEIVTPSSPVYTYGLAMDRYRSHANFPDSPPEFGIVSTKTGFTVVEIYPDVRTTVIRAGLTAEAAHIILKRYGGRFNRLFVHESLPKSFLKSWQIAPEQCVPISGYTVLQFPIRMEEMIKIDLSLAADTPFYHSEEKTEKDLSPKPLYQGTAEQMGILPLRGIPDLMEAMLPMQSPVTCKNLLREYLLQPPPENIANDLRTALNAIFTKSMHLPDFPVTNPARYVKTLHQHEASPQILRDLFQVSKSFLACYQTRFMPCIPHVLHVVSHLSHLPIQAEVLQEKSHIITHLLNPVIPLDRDEAYIPQHEGISPHLFESIEDEFRGRVARTSTADISRLYIQVREAAKSYEETLIEQLGALTEKNRNLSYDIHNKAIWLRGNTTAKEQETYKLIHPLDRYNKIVKDRWSTEIVEAAFLHYKNTVEKTTHAVAELLKNLAEELAVHSVSIVHLATFANVMRMLTLHAEQGKSRGWGISVNDELLEREQTTPKLSIRGGFPYWMPPNIAVKNTITLNGISILTGHNMAGKSTLLRSVGVITLLASSGLLFPAEQVTWSHPLESWFVRTGSHDDPQAGLSSFAVEITEVNTALRDATQNSLLLIDELGKGTESQAGHAIAASVLEYVRDKKIRGIFATHWHEIFQNPKVDLSNIETWQMEIVENTPTYRVRSGRCLTSWAFEAARKLGMKPHLLRRAQDISEAHISNHLPTYQLASSSPEHTLETVTTFLASLTNTPETNIHYLPVNGNPPPAINGQSVLYVLRTPQRFFYVGETDSFPTRLKAHYQDSQKKNSEGMYVVIPQGKSHARRLENKLISILRTLEFPLLSSADEQKKHFGGL